MKGVTKIERTLKIYTSMLLGLDGLIKRGGCIGPKVEETEVCPEAVVEVSAITIFKGQIH